MEEKLEMLNAFRQDFDRFFEIQTNVLFDTLKERMQNSSQDLDWEEEMEDIVVEFGDIFDKVTCMVSSFQ